MNFRIAAFELLSSWKKNRSYMNKLLSAFHQKHSLSAQELSACNAVCLGVVERKTELDYLISLLSNIKLRKIKPQILTVLEMGIYQLTYMDFKPYAVCNEMTDLTKKIGFSGLSGYVNAVLRAYLRRKDEIEYPDEKKQSTEYLSITYSVPEWLCKHFVRETGWENTVRSFSYFLNHRGAYVRTVRSRISTDEIVELLNQCRIAYQRSDLIDYVFYIENMKELLETELLQKGYLQVQNLSSVLVGEILKNRLKGRILDICAAPGGKSLHLADILKVREKEDPNSCASKITSRDIRDFGIEMLRERAELSGFDNIEAERKDACTFFPEDENRYDVIVADLPCSGLGVIAQKPDIKYYSSPEGMIELARLQSDILKNAVRYLKEGGILLYSTCTVSKVENIDVTDRLLKETEELEPFDIKKELPEEMRKTGNECWRIQLLPGEFGSDGFFISGFTKNKGLQIIR